MACAVVKNAVSADADAYFVAQPETCVAGLWPHLRGGMAGFGHHPYVHGSCREGAIFETCLASDVGNRGDISIFWNVGAISAKCKPLPAMFGECHLGKDGAVVKGRADADLESPGQLCGLPIQGRRS
ncbi:hypothetical protein [Roseateles sp.]|uniref:hypothetical protein n=1 Tax=Roseateles sp. TaxID=1971397 RepID=UPI0039E95876